MKILYADDGRNPENFPLNDYYNYNLIVMNFFYVIYYITIMFFTYGLLHFFHSSPYWIKNLKQVWLNKNKNDLILKQLFIYACPPPEIENGLNCALNSIFYHKNLKHYTGTRVQGHAPRKF